MAAIQAIFRERYEARSSPLHRLDGRVKLPATLAYIFAITATAEGAWLAVALMAAPLVPLIAAARLSPLLVLRRTFLALPFVLVALPLIFTRPGETVATMPLVGWTASREGLEAVATILAKSWIAVALAALLTMTTPVPELMRALRAMRVPRILVATIYFTYRYLFVIGDEALRMLRARASRSAAVEGYRAGGSIRWRGRVAGHMTGSLFVRSLERSERVYGAMQARGFTGEQRFLANPPVRAFDVGLGALFVAYGVAVQLAVRL